jgi:cysteine desulfurase
MDNWGNPSSIHQLGRMARAALDNARERAAHCLGCKPSEIVFTGGGTESANLAVLGTARQLRSKGRHIITSSIEHHAVLHACRYLAAHENFEVTYLPVDRLGRVDPASLKPSIRPDTILVSVMAANNEVGTLQPTAELGAICRNKGILFHTDAVQWFGKMPFSQLSDFNADLVSICAHKLYGPKGAGALYIRSPLKPDPILFGGAHENEHRAGTENLLGILGLVYCIEHFIRTPVFDSDQLSPLTRRIAADVARLPGVVILGPRDGRLCNTISFVVLGTDSIALLAALDLEGICASSGSACSAGSLEPSHVVQAMGFASDLANALVRFSLGRESTLTDVEYVLEALPQILRRVQLLN